jgi:hypothetical protein
MNLQFVNSLLPSKWHCFPFHASVWVPTSNWMHLW